jgi:hypothetical protein
LGERKKERKKERKNALNRCCSPQNKPGVMAFHLNIQQTDGRGAFVVADEEISLHESFEAADQRRMMDGSGGPLFSFLSFF